MISAYIHPHNWQPVQHQKWSCKAESGQKLIEFGQCEFVCYFVFFFVCLGSQREHTQALPKMSTDFVFVDCLSRSLPPDIGCASLNGCKWANKNNTTCHWRLPFRFRFRFQIFVGDSVEQSAQVYNAFVGFVSVLQSLINSGINYNT